MLLSFLLSLSFSLSLSPPASLVAGLGSVGSRAQTAKLNLYLMCAHFYTIKKKKEIWRPKTQRYEPQKSNKSPVVNLAQSDHAVLRHFIWAFTRGDRNHFSNHIPPSLHSSKHRKSAIDNLSYLRNPQGTTARGHISLSLSARALAHN